MKKLTFEILINAPKEIVWNIIIGDDTYPEWASVFCEGSKAVTNWATGSKALFVDDSNSGMVSIIEENIPYSFLSIKHVGEVKDGIEDTDSENVKAWAGLLENYTLKENGERTFWIVEMDATPEFATFMEDLWPKAQQKVKEMAEAIG
ncbi:SRPBCC domain-containing protein [Pedobacter lithocola]|uniref:SRPBCC domain-containing protein n=1 Tax=Pedobacter lithocola TaxID=1908239 RepID=A0ABV8P6P7_9SPHI